MADKEKSAAEEWIGNIGALIVFAAFALAIWKHAYHVHFDQTYVQAKPEDCNYDYAPVGHKGCHYEARPTTTDGQGGNKSVHMQWNKVPGDD